MAKARKILAQVKAIRNIATVTKTMSLVSTARFKKTHDVANGARPYNNALNDLIADTVARSSEKDLRHPLLHPAKEVGTEVLLVLGSHRGLCGAYNGSIAKLTVERLEQLKTADLKVLVRGTGRRGLQHLRARGVEIDVEYPQFDYLPRPAEVNQLADALMEEFLSGKISGLEVAYMQFVSAGRQKPAIAQILPMSEMEAPERVSIAIRRPTPYEFIPSPGEVLKDLLPASVRLKLYQCFLDAAVSEQISRMTAMRAATDNAEEMIRNLTIRYNRARQAQITTELAEIMGGSEMSE
ncbi:MAG: ATP synthase F1 subunit gamma [Planctomycetes bacterium]|jgi:F-type H+-transporting ATPase subunit gamma|nr:ATP synthase F1 subunit gamma [Planctomycetota bacterium]